MTYEEISEMSLLRLRALTAEEKREALRICEEAEYSENQQEIIDELTALLSN